MKPSELKRLCNEALDLVQPTLVELRGKLAEEGYILIIETTTDGKFEFSTAKRSNTFRTA